MQSQFKIESLQRYFLKLSYDGTAYNGWQIQDNTPKTIQQILNTMLSQLFNQEVFVTGCGRTDTGVHASEYYAHFDLDKDNLLAEKDMWIHKFNKFLPKDIAIYTIYNVKSDANCRFDAIGRTYEYKINRTKNPFVIDKACYIYGDINVNEMNKAASCLLNHIDFSAFSKSNTQNATNNCIITKAEWVEKDELLIFTITANRFLRNMVRAIVGTLIDVGKGKLSVHDFNTIIESMQRSNAGLSVLACGLYLKQVEYPKNYFNV